MACGWVLCMTIASLPLFEISDYRKFANCLPFETGSTASLGKCFRIHASFSCLLNGLEYPKP